MRLTHAWFLALAATSGSAVRGFQLSNSPRVGSSMRVSATVNEVSEATTSPNGAMTYADVNNLAFRALQRECKSLGLSAIGTTAALRGRLLEHFGLTREAAAVEAPKATAAEIEVRFCSNKMILYFTMHQSLAKNSLALNFFNC